MQRVILHSDMNNFYASVETLFDPTLQNVPLVVAGDAELRHGIVLAKNYLAKAHGICTGEALWQARQKCPDVVFVPAHYDRYLHYSALAKELYISYTDQVEPFGLDECWLDVSGSVGLFGDGKTMADNIRSRVKRELGLTVSIGVSFNKVFAKLGSDMKKPDATTVIGPTDYQEKAWALPVSDLLYVGPATTKKLNQFGIHTIGDLAKAPQDFLLLLLGKVGDMLWRFANGQDSSGVSTYYTAPPIKTIGNSTTAPRDLVTDDDVKITLYALCESVAARLRAQRSICSTVQLGIRDDRLTRYERQAKLLTPGNDSRGIFDAAFAIFQANRPERPVRSLSIRASGLELEPEAPQLSLFQEDARAQRSAELERTVDRIRKKYGYKSIRRGIMLQSPELDLDAQSQVVHPAGFLGTL